MSDAMREMMLKSANEKLAILINLRTTMPNSPSIIKMVDDAQADVAKYTAMAPAPVAAPQPTPGAAKAPGTLEEWAKGVETRLGELEGLVKTVAAPALDQAAQAGMMIMGALGKGMTEEQAAWVQQHVEKSPEFFASSNCKAAIDIFISEWETFEGAPK